MARRCDRELARTPNARSATACENGGLPLTSRTAWCQNPMSAGEQGSSGGTTRSPCTNHGHSPPRTSGVRGQVEPLCNQLAVSPVLKRAAWSPSCCSCACRNTAFPHVRPIIEMNTAMASAPGFPASKMNDDCDGESAAPRSLATTGTPAVSPSISPTACVHGSARDACGEASTSVPEDAPADEQRGIVGHKARRLPRTRHDGFDLGTALPHQTHRFDENPRLQRRASRKEDAFKGYPNGEAWNA